MSTFYMPTKVIMTDNAVINNSELFKKLGNKALIVTGKKSAKLNGSLDDVLEALKKENIDYMLFDNVEENPSIENIMEGAKAGRDAELIIGIGGGSPIDAAKAIGLLIKNPDIQPRKAFWNSEPLETLPLIAVPTTAGTGSETTPYSIVTDHERKTKQSLSQKIFPKYSLIDIKYFLTMPKSVRINTTIDALCHLVEGYLCTHSNQMNQWIAEEGCRLWGQAKEEIYGDTISKESMDKLIRASTLAGMLISHTGTSIPHGMGYSLTYHHNVPHGKATGIVLKAYMAICSEDKVNKIIELLGFDTLNAFGDFIKQGLGDLTISNDKLKEHVAFVSKNKAKLKAHPGEITEDDIYNIYKESLNIK